MSSDQNPKQRQACIQCRGIKIRCLDNDDQTIQCQRCRRLNIPCVYTRQRRGRKTNAEREAIRASTQGISMNRRTVIKPAMAPPTAHLDANPTFSVVRNSLPLYSSVSDSAIRTTTTSSTTSMKSPSLAMLEYGVTTSGPSVSPSSGQVSTPSIRTSAARRQTVDVSEYLEPEIDDFTRLDERTMMGRESNNLIPPSNMNMEDPIALNYLSLLDARNLVRLFHLHLNPKIALLDPKLHTFEYLRQTSAILLTAVLTAAAKFFRPELHGQLLTHAQTILNRATTVGECDVEIVQALMILVYWKAPTDRSAWVKLGIAVRLGYQMGWHIRSQRLLPDDDHEARLILDPERTWYCLACFDNLYSSVFDLPRAIKLSEIGDAERWAREHRHLMIDADMHLACSISSFPVRQMWGHLASQIDTLPREYARNALADMITHDEEYCHKWFSRSLASDGFNEDEQRSLLWFHMDTMLKQKYLMFNLVEPDERPLALLECMSLLERFAVQINIVAEDGFLLLLQDIASSTISSWAQTIYKLFWHLSQNQKRTVIGLVKRVHKCCSQVANGNDQAATAFVARFLQRVLRRISLESRPVSRAPSPLPNEVNVAEQVSDELVLSELNDFLLLPNLPTSSDALMDEQYWASLFSTAPFTSGPL